jgi:hypothetical protein
MAKTVKTILLSALMAIAAGCTGSDGEGQQEQAAYQGIDTVPMLITQINKCSRFYTTEMKVHKIVTHDDDVRLKGSLLKQDAGNLDYMLGSRGQLIASNGAWGEKCQWLVNPDGSKASGMFQQLLPLCAERYAFLEMAGEAYDSVVLGRAQMAWNYGNCRYGLMDARGRILIRARYREVRALSSDRLLLIGDDRVQISDRNGVVMKTWITPEGSESSSEANE